MIILVKKNALIQVDNILVVRNFELLKNYENMGSLKKQRSFCLFLETYLSILYCI